MTELSQLLDAAHWHFGLGAEESRRGSANTFYVEVPASLSRGGLSLGRNHPLDTSLEPEIESESLLSPTAYLAGIDLCDSWYEQPVRRVPSISIVVGEYGLGKTELLHGVAESLRDAKAATGVDVLPISLASARGLRPMAPSYEPRAFLGALLHHIAGALPDPLLDEIAARIGDGSLFVLLDALDELVSDETEHRIFIDSLGRLVAALAPTESSHIVLSMRLEHLSAIYRGQSLKRAGASLEAAADNLVQVNFLLLDFFSDAMVSDYVSYRIGESKAIDMLPRNREFRDLLRRPLLARILCDLVPENPKKRRDLLSDLEGVSSAAALFRLFTIYARNDQVLESAQAKIYQRFDDVGRLRWSHRQLSAAALRAHLSGQSELDRSAILSVLVEEVGTEGVSIGQPDKVVASRLSDDELWMAIYKCPFLKRVGISKGSAEDATLRIAFTPWAFFEYFVTEGVVLELEHRRGSKDLAFHNLVLNVDMHRFLRDLTILTGAAKHPSGLVTTIEGFVVAASHEARPAGEAWWYQETGRAYGLEDDSLEEWQEFGGLTPERRERLDAVRRPLLDARSGLKDSVDPDDLRKAVELFLDEDDGPEPQLAPRYLIPNYEAVAVCLLKPWVGTVELHGRFASLLETRLKETTDKLLGDQLDHSSRVIYELLVERLLDVGLRCNYSWARRPFEVLPDRSKAEKYESGLVLVIEVNQNTRKRIVRLLEEARRARSG